MPKSATVYDVLLSCPSDVKGSIRSIEKAIHQFNNCFGRTNSIILRTLYWADDTYSEFVGNPQEKINKQIVESSDLAISFFWTRFGSPTLEYGSGTEEEIETMIAAKKQVFLFFLDKPINPSKIDYDQYMRLEAFRKKHEQDGIFFCVDDENELTTKVTNNLELYFASIIDGQTFKGKSGKHNILWVDDRPENNVYVRNILENYGLEFYISLSTQQALQFLGHNKVDLIISDMGRKEGSREGYVLLDSIRQSKCDVPLIFYAGSRHPAHIEETLKHGGQGCTNDPTELVDLVIKNLLNHK